MWLNIWVWRVQRNKDAQTTLTIFNSCKINLFSNQIATKSLQCTSSARTNSWLQTQFGPRRGLFTPAQQTTFGHSHFSQKIPPYHPNGVPEINMQEFPGPRVSVGILPKQWISRNCLAHPDFRIWRPHFQHFGGKWSWYVGQRSRINQCYSYSTRWISQGTHKSP